MACFPKQYGQYVIEGCDNGTPTDMVVTYKLVDPSDKTVEFTTDHVNFTTNQPAGWTPGVCEKKKYDMEVETQFCQFYDPEFDTNGDFLSRHSRVPVWFYHYSNVEDPTDNYLVVRHLADKDDPSQGYVDDQLDPTLPLSQLPQRYQDLQGDPDLDERIRYCCDCEDKNG